MPKQDGLVRLPDHVTASLLRALMCIRPRPESRLILHPTDYDRPPAFDAKTDFDVLFRGGVVGRMWRHEYRNHPWQRLGPWHWDFRDAAGGKSIEGHAPTLQAAMADFRSAWDRARDSGVA